MDESWGWSGLASDFVTSSAESWIGSLTSHHRGLMSKPPSGSQVEAWRKAHGVISHALQGCIAALPDAARWGVVFEYELPLEGGRRPDVVILSGGSISVLEFKSTRRAAQSQIDQVAAYARDIADYHEASHGIPVQPLLVLPNAEDDYAISADGVVATGRAGLGEYLTSHARPGEIDLQGWLDSPYAPLPTLVAAARRLFEHEHLPHVRYALAAGIPETLEILEGLARRAAEDGSRIMAFVTGVPGAGKTLVGLRFVYERSDREGRGIFLSGNGPLVDVLQHALRSREFVRDLHAYIRTYGIGTKTPREHVVVFDEAQRAWDKGFMSAKRSVPHSEPELLVQAGERIPGWSALIGLVGEGQNIFSGEEGGIAQWREAIEASPDPGAWSVHCPPHISHEFEGLNTHTAEKLHLDVALRARRADEIHEWVRLLLGGSLPLANRMALRFLGDFFQMYVTRDLQEAKNYAIARYLEHLDARYGLVASSHAKLPLRYGLDTSFLQIRKLKVGPWFNAPQGDPQSCCALAQPVTEFQCQGLELDLPVVCWGEDLTWDGRVWQLKPKRRQYQPQDPQALLRNTYRVLLTRGRDGLVVWIPPEEGFDLTEHALLAAGIRPLPEEIVLAGEIINGS